MLMTKYSEVKSISCNHDFSFGNTISKAGSSISWNYWDLFRVIIVFITLNNFFEFNHFYLSSTCSTVNTYVYTTFRFQRNLHRAVTIIWCGNLCLYFFNIWNFLSNNSNYLQINLSNCRISDLGLYNLMGNLTRLQDAKLLNLSNVTMNGFELALRASCFRLKKIKMLAFVRPHISMETLNLLQTRGCKIKWD